MVVGEGLWYFLIIKYLALFRLFHYSLTELHLCLFDLILRPSQRFFQHVGIGRPGFTSAKQGLVCPAQGNNTLPPEDLSCKPNIFVS